MKVKKLINKLKNYPEDMEVYVFSVEGMLVNDIVFEESLDVDGDTVEDILIIMDNDEYLKTMYQLKDQYKDQIEVLVGFEIEY